MRARHAKKIRFAMRLAETTFWAESATYDAVRAANLWFPHENPFCRTQHIAFVRTYERLQKMLREMK